MDKENIKKTRRLRFSPTRVILSAIVFTISGYLLFSVSKEVLTTIELTKDLQVYTKQLETIENETRDLKERIEKLNDPDYIKSFARGEYSITKEGEQVFRLPSIIEKDNDKKDD
ncbi:MAG: hypothetical protein GX769_03275 [Erysipelothrix sp.]|nr:hypothetical protein [Erysipelothrix sp.]